MEIKFEPATKDGGMDNHKEVESALEAFKACNLKNPDTDDSQDSEQEELFTKHYLEALG